MMRVEAVEGKIIRIVKLRKRGSDTRFHNFYIIEAEDGKQYEVIDYTKAQLYEMGDIILADNYHYAKDCFQQAKIVKIVESV